AGAELTDLRDHVDSLTRQVTAAAAEFERRSARRDAARGALDAARRDALDDRDALGVVLSDLAQLVGAAGVTTRTPDAPAITFVPARGHDVELPTNAVDPEAMRKQLGDVRAGARARGGDIRE